MKAALETWGAGSKMIDLLLGNRDLAKGFNALMAQKTSIFPGLTNNAEPTGGKDELTGSPQRTPMETRSQLSGAD